MPVAPLATAPGSCVGAREQVGAPVVAVVQSSAASVVAAAINPPNAKPSFLRSRYACASWEVRWQRHPSRMAAQQRGVRRTRPRRDRRASDVVISTGNRALNINTCILSRQHQIADAGRGINMACQHLPQVWQHLGPAIVSWRLDSALS